MGRFVGMMVVMMMMVMVMVGIIVVTEMVDGMFDVTIVAGSWFYGCQVRDLAWIGLAWLFTQILFAFPVVL